MYTNKENKINHNERKPNYPTNNNNYNNGEWQTVATIVRDETGSKCMAHLKIFWILILFACSLTVNEYDEGMLLCYICSEAFPASTKKNGKN